MTPEPENPNPDNPYFAPRHGGHTLTWTFILFAIIVVIAFGISLDYGDPQSNWANYLGSGLACGTLSLVTAAIILFFALGFPKNRTTWRIFISKMAIPMMLTGCFWIWRTNEISEKQFEKGRYAKRVEEEMTKQSLRKKEAEPVIRMAKIELDDILIRRLKDKEGVIKIDGWSASSLDGGTWLVKFEFSENGEDKWMLYEYNDYLRDFKSVFTDEALKSHYLDTEGSSFNQATERRMGDWYGPVR